MMMKIAIGADHGGFELKDLLVQRLRQLGHNIDDVGCHSLESVDYPEYADRVCTKVGGAECDVGILICGTGIGMSMAANKHRKIRAALCHDEYTARLSREHNNANVLCLGARVLGGGIAEAIVVKWLSSNFAGERHLRRVKQYSD
jgi:ribose 5-phosphate isomerase B